MDKISPATKPLPAKEGIRMPSEHKALTTPNPTFGKYSGGYKDGSNAVNSESLMGKK